MPTGSSTCAMASLWMPRWPTEMGTIWHGISRTIFWSYERGSWPYDLMVLSIVLFVLVTPRGWFHDQPQTGVLPGADVQMIAGDAASHTWTYRVDAQLLAPSKRAPKSTPELEKQTHEILGQTVEELKGQRFQITNIAPVPGDDGAVLYYDVAVKR